MADFWKELEEEIREEHYWSLWTRLQPWVLTAMSCIVLGAASWHVWERSETIRQDRATRYYLALVGESDASKKDLFFKELTRGAHGGYRTYARLYTFLEGVRKAVGERDRGQWLALKAQALRLAESHHGRDLQGFLAVVSGYTALHLFLDEQEVWQNLEKVAQQKGPWQGLALEVLLLRAYQGQDHAGFAAWLAVPDVSWDPATLQRVRFMAMAMGAGLPETWERQEQRLNLAE